MVLNLLMNKFSLEITMSFRRQHDTFISRNIL